MLKTRECKITIFQGFIAQMLSCQGVNDKKVFKKALFNVERQFLESCTSDFEEMNKVKFQSITEVEMEYSLSKFVMPLT